MDEYEKQARRYLWSHCLVSSDESDRRICIDNLKIMLRDAAAKAREDEREACAVLANDITDHGGYISCYDMRASIVEAIRARGKS